MPTCLREAEQLVLLTLLQLDREGYGVTDFVLFQVFAGDTS